ncbi:MAG TPA: amidophosphoribosyltransferase [Dehalococcoidia bacterium]|nr:amidophosphoribosyltransferase [Dehalococcoidia bacterium]
MNESCGIFGVFAPNEDVARITFFGLYALQHRGQESAGIATAQPEIDAATGESKWRFFIRKDMGLVAQVFQEQDLSYLKGHAAIGHTRYSTTGSSRVENAQPFQVEGPNGVIALGHNGNIVNADLLRAELQAEGREFETSTDSEVIAHLVATAPGRDWGERMAYVMRRARGAYCLTILTKEGVIATRDPLGMRPLGLARIDNGYCYASETCAFDLIGASFIRDVEPGETVLLNEDGITSFKFPERDRQAFCIFEYIYFARPDSYLRGERIYPVRMAMGARLAREYPVDADIVIGVPDSATAAAIGYARESGIPFVEGLVKNRYVGRTFIMPDQRIREQGVRLKYNPVREILEGQRVVVVDDTIVRATTTRFLVKMLREAGAREVHMRVSAPPITHPCFFGIDMGRRWELIAAQETVEEIRNDIGADSLGYLTEQGLVEAVGQPRESFCMACFTGDYPMDVPRELDKLGLEPPEWIRDRHDIEWVATNGPVPERRRRLWDEAATPAP